MDAVLTSPGTYVVAVSGGVDSMTLLHALAANPDYSLVVAHLDHGTRPDSAEDRRLVQRTAAGLGLPFIYEEARLGPGTSEAAAREVRYDFLRRVRSDHGARAIVTAHHRDDVLETAIINLLRGSGRKGLTALDTKEDVERPLLEVSKSDIIAYAKDQGLEWHDDSTNLDTDYLRNYVRHQLLPRFGPEARDRLHAIITDLRTTNAGLDDLLADQLSGQPDAGRLDRAWFIQLPHGVARETMAAWLRANGLHDFDSKTLERLVAAAKTAAPGKRFDVLHGTELTVGRHELALAGVER